MELNDLFYFFIFIIYFLFYFSGAILSILEFCIFCSLQEVKERLNEIPLLDPIKDMNIKAHQLKKLIEDVDALRNRLESMPINEDPKLGELCELYDKKFKVNILHIKFFFSFRRILSNSQRPF